MDLDISGNSFLLYLNCNSNKISNLNISNNFNLRSLYLKANQLTILDISKNTILERLYCQNIKIQTICVNSLNQVKPDWQKDASAPYKICN
jgi:Leucine-rich repeat (LRR) protein